MVKETERRKSDASEEQSLQRRLLYGLSLPERALRSTAGLVGGTLRESAAVVLPDALRNAKTYQIFIGQMLDFMAEDVGRIGVPRAAKDRPDDFLARKTVGNFVDLTSLATLHLSPMLLLAVVSDVAYGSKTYLRELAEELQKRGVIADASAIERIDDLLDQVAAASNQAATTLDQPPLSAEGLKETVRQTRETLARIDVAKVLPERELAAIWNDMQAAARKQGVSAFNVSGLMALGSLRNVAKIGNGALSTAQVAGTLLNRHVLSHYREVLGDINQAGFYPTLSATSRPYLQAAWGNFSSQRLTLTESFLGRGGAQRTWRKAKRWLGQGGRGE